MESLSLLFGQVALLSLRLEVVLPVAVDIGNYLASQQETKEYETSNFGPSLN